MEKNINKIEEIVNKSNRLIDIWGRRNPKFEKRYEESVIKVLSVFGRSTDSSTSAKGKYFGNAYEPYIIAFFLGLYANKRLPLSDDSDDLKDLGWPIENWGNVERRDLRKPYSALRSYMFMALIARTDVDWIALDKGDIKASSVVTALISTMEEYANYGFSVMKEKLDKDKTFFYSNRALLDIFLQLTDKEKPTKTEDDELEEL